MFKKSVLLVAVLFVIGLVVGCGTSFSEPEEYDDGRTTFNIEYFNTMGLQNQNPETFQKNEDVTLQDLSKVNYKFTGWYLNDAGSPIKGWTAGTYKKDLSLYAKWTYPDEIRGENGRLGYACDKSLNYTISISTSEGGYSTSLNYKSGDAVSAIRLEDVPWEAMYYGVVWTFNVSAVNATEGLKYTGKTTETISDNGLSLHIPILTRAN
ncbi:MAG: InlB B-repeat-containing protein [Treponema sp.]|nr:InlB B-repeat-containing protein [Treponema sp.]